VAGAPGGGGGGMVQWAPTPRSPTHRPGRPPPPTVQWSLTPRSPSHRPGSRCLAPLGPAAAAWHDVPREQLPAQSGTCISCTVTPLLL
jgi:hypothetical protein